MNVVASVTFLLNAVHEPKSCESVIPPISFGNPDAMAQIRSYEKYNLRGLSLLSKSFHWSNGGGTHFPID